MALTERVHSYEAIPPERKYFLLMYMFFWYQYLFARTSGYLITFSIQFASRILHSFVVLESEVIQLSLQG